MKTLLRTLAIMTAASGIVAAPGLAQSTSGFVLHVANASYDGCDTVVEATTTCETIDIEGDSQNTQFVFIMTFGYNVTNFAGWGGGADAGIAGAQFGIFYDPGVTVQAWSLCTGGAEIPQTDPAFWPASETGNAVTWAGACYDSPSPDDFTTVGYFTVSDFSSGLMFIQGDPRIANRPSGVVVTDCENSFYDVDALTAYSSASVNGPDANARKSCSMPVPIEETTWGQLKNSYSD